MHQFSINIRRIFSNLPFYPRRLLVVILCVTCLGCGISETRKAAKRVKAKQNVQRIIGGINDYFEKEGKYPDKLEDIKEHIKPYDEVIVSPYSSDNPGFIYLKPKDIEGKSADEIKKIVVVVNSKDGDPDPKTVSGSLGGEVKIADGN